MSDGNILLMTLSSGGSLAIVSQKLSAVAFHSMPRVFVYSLRDGSDCTTRVSFRSRGTVGVKKTLTFW